MSAFAEILARGIQPTTKLLSVAEQQKQAAVLADTQAQARQRDALAQQEQAKAQQMKQAQRDSDAFGKALANWDGKPETLSKVGMEAIKNGASVGAYHNFETTRATVAKEAGLASKAEREAAAAAHERRADILSSVIDAPPEQQDDAYRMALETGIQEGVIKPGELPPTNPGTGALQLHLGLTRTRLAGLEQANKAQDLKDKQATLERETEKQPLTVANLEETLRTERQKNTGTQPIQPVEQARIDVEKTNAQREADALKETQRHNLSTESTAKLTAAVAQGRLAQEQTVNGMKYGPGTQEYWVKQLQENPDSIKEMPAELRTAVGQKFKEATGLPLPTPLNAATQTQETAARNALDGITFIEKALQNPEIRANIGPIMGRLGNAEQALGTAPNLSPEASQLAQELRTRMRYFVFQEGKAVLGGRLPQQLMQQLEESSASPKMDPDILQGALNGARGNAQNVMENADKQRFGGKSRASARGGSSAVSPIKLKDGRVLTPHSQADADAFKKEHPELIQ